MKERPVASMKSACAQLHCPFNRCCAPAAPPSKAGFLTHACAHVKKVQRIHPMKQVTFRHACLLQEVERLHIGGGA